VEKDLDYELKETLHQAIGGPGGICTVLMLLRDLAREKAADERHIRDNEPKALAWENLAKAIERAFAVSLPVMEMA
jgi:hypothetical protein